MFFYEKWQEEKVEKQTSELKLLKSQYNPHFLFNALNSIYSKTLDVSDEASELVLKLSSILRYNLALDDTELITMEDEIIYINNYLDIQKVRLSHKVQIKLITHVEDDDTLIAPLFIVPLIENAFKYGVNNTDECFIFISIKQSKNILEVKIKNSKVIIDATLPASESFGLGLKNVKRRLDLYYPNRHDMTINETDDEYSVSLQLNMNK